MVEDMYGRNERPTFNPGVPRETYSQFGRFIALPRLDFMRGYTIGDFTTMQRMTEKLQRAGPLQEIGRGEDMVAYSRPDLEFVIKFPYDEFTGQPTRFNYRISYGYSLAKGYLGGIFAPSIDIYGTFTDSDGKEYGIVTLVQQKVKTLAVVFKELSTQNLFDEIASIKQTFIKLNQIMWERGIFDCDSNWEENYGLLPYGTLVLIDVGWLLDDPSQFSSYYGIPRVRQYERALRDNFTDDNFRRFFGTRPHPRGVRTRNPQVKLGTIQN